MIFGVELKHIIIGLCSVYGVVAALALAWYLATAPVDPPWGER